MFASKSQMPSKMGHIPSETRSHIEKLMLVTERLRFKFLLFNPFPQDKILEQAKLKAFADDKLNVT